MQVVANWIEMLLGRHTKEFYEDSFYALTGMLSGIALNDLWRILNLPGNYIPIKDKGKDMEQKQDFGYQALLGVGIMLGHLFGIKHSLVFGGSLIAGSGWANASEQGGTIKVLPF